MNLSPTLLMCRLAPRQVAALLLIVLLGPGAAGQPSLGPKVAATTIPTTPSEAAVERGAQAVQQYTQQHGPLSIAVALSYLAEDGDPASTRPAVADALAAEVEKQLADYTDDRVILTVEALNDTRARRLTERQSADAPSATFLREVAELTGSPYVLSIEVAPDTSGVKDAGAVSLRLIEVATGRVLTSISDQYWQDKDRYPEVPDAIWVQHSVTYWMEELMAARGLPRALRGPYLATLRFEGDLPAGSREKLRSLLAEATQVPETAVNPRFTRQGYDIVAVDLMLQQPPHLVMNALIQQVSAGLSEDGLRVEPLRQSGGDVIFAVSSTPLWYAMTTPPSPPAANGDTGSGEDPMRQTWKQLIDEADAPALAVLSYTSDHAADDAADRRDHALLAGQGRALAQAIESEWIAAGLPVVGVEPVSQPFQSAAGAGLTQLSDHLRQRARWVCYVEAVPAGDGAPGPVRLLARLIDLRDDRVVGAASFPAADAELPAGSANMDRLQLAARYLTGSLMGDAVSNPALHQTLRLTIRDCPSFDFGQRIGNIALAQSGVKNVALPRYDSNGTYTLAVRYLADPGAFADRLRADLSSLPLGVTGSAEGELTFAYTD